MNGEAFGTDLRVKKSSVTLFFSAIAFRELLATLQTLQYNRTGLCCNTFNLLARRHMKQTDPMQWAIL